MVEPSKIAFISGLLNSEAVGSAASLGRAAVAEKPAGATRACCWGALGLCVKWGVLRDAASARCAKLHEVEPSGLVVMPWRVHLSGRP